MAALRVRLAAVRAVTAAIRPALTRFYGALDQGQKVGLVGTPDYEFGGQEFESLRARQ